MAPPNRSRGPPSWINRKVAMKHYRPDIAVGIYVIRSSPRLLGLGIACLETGRFSWGSEVPDLSQPVLARAVSGDGHPLALRERLDDHPGQAVHGCLDQRGVPHRQCGAVRSEEHTSQLQSREN